MTADQFARSIGDSQVFGRCILNVAFPFSAVSDDAGGAEQIVAKLDRAIVERGGKSLVIACENSRVNGKLNSVSSATGRITPELQDKIRREVLEKIEQTLREESVDLIHFHGTDFDCYLPKTTVPKLVTLHLPPAWYPQEVFRYARSKNAFLHCVSQSQHRECPNSEALLSPITNGVFVPEQPPTTDKSDYVVSLGRICPEKGFHIALNAAKRANIRMSLAGALFEYETHCNYFEHEIMPRLDEQRRFIGPVGGKQKQELLAQARCVLIPSLAPETSSLVAMEALANGTPVIAFPNGALGEIIQDGLNGFLVKDEGEMAEAIPYTATLSPKQCWESARCRFDAQRMVAAYLRRYEIIIRGCTALIPKLNDVAAL